MSPLATAPRLKSGLARSAPCDVQTFIMRDDSPEVVKLSDLLQVSGWQHKLPWKPFQPGVEIYRLYGDGVSGPTAALLRFRPGGRVPLHEHMGFEHILVLSGSQVDENSKSETGMLIINPPGTSHSVLSENGCIVLAIYEKPVRFLGTEGGTP
jgi:anti-sigma factor ChrR (cupin superfamily)